MFTRSTKIQVFLIAVVFLVSGVGAVALANHSTNPDVHLKAVGPVSPDNGFPVWYQDANGMTLELCLDDAAQCLLPLTPPFTFPDPFPDEAFYFSAGASMPTTLGPGTADIGLDLEAAFVNGPVVPGDQMAFGRIRIRIDDLQPGGSYSVTHPYGTDTVVAEPDGTVFVTEDIGNMTGGPNFGEALNSRIGPFLTWDTYPGDPLIPAGFISDSTVAHTVTGSPFGTNFFRVEGPGLPPAGIQTNEFFVMGKLSTIAGVQPTRATYARDVTGGAIDVVALSQPGQVIDVDGPGISQTTMRGDAAGNYYARLDFSAAGAPPALTVTNAGDTPPTVARITPVDQVIVTGALYDADTQILNVTASSSDQLSPPVLTAYREDGTTVLGTLPLTLIDIVVPPAKVVVKSAAGGADTEQVQISGAVFPTVPLLAIAGPDQSVPQGATVTLDGTNSTGDIATYAWEQTAGPGVTLSNPNAAVAGFTAGAAPSVYTFQLKVDDNPDVNPASTDEVVITVEDVTPPVANAGPDQGPSQAVVKGATITLNGSTSTGATDFHWTRVPDLAPFANTAIATYVLPNADPVTFRLDVTGPGGSTSDTVLITPLADTLTVISGKFTRNKNEWDIRGTAAVLGAPAGAGNTVSIYRGPALPSNLISANAPVDNLGAWRFRGVPGTPGGAPPAGVTTQQITVVSTRGGGPTTFNAQVK